MRVKQLPTRTVTSYSAHTVGKTKKIEFLGQFQSTLNVSVCDDVYIFNVSCHVTYDVTCAWEACLLTRFHCLPCQLFKTCARVDCSHWKLQVPVSRMMDRHSISRCCGRRCSGAKCGSELPTVQRMHQRACCAG